jgi:hypothetical protein
MSRSYGVNFNFYGSVFLEKIFKVLFPNANTCKNGFCPGTINFTNMILPYVKMLSCKKNKKQNKTKN